MSVVPESVERSRGEQAVAAGGFAHFGEVRIGVGERAGLFVAPNDEGERAMLFTTPHTDTANRRHRQRTHRNPPHQRPRYCAVRGSAFARSSIAIAGSFIASASADDSILRRSCARGLLEFPQQILTEFQIIAGHKL